MQKFAMVLLAAGLAACSADGVPPTDPLVAPGDAAFAKKTFTVNETNIPLSGMLGDPCNGGTVLVEGKYHVRQTTWDNGHLSVQVNTQGISGVSGDGTHYNYIVVQSAGGTAELDPPYYPWSETINQTVKVVTSGPGMQNYSAHIIVTYGQDADGNYYTDFKQDSEVCR